MAETLCFVAEQRGADVCVARIFNTYGPYMRADDGRVVTNVLHALFTGDPIRIYGSGEQTRCFTYVDDLVDGLLLLMDTGMRGPTNVGSDSEITINGSWSVLRRLSRPSFLTSLYGLRSSTRTSTRTILVSGIQTAPRSRRSAGAPSLLWRSA